MTVFQETKNHGNKPKGEMIAQQQVKAPVGLLQMETEVIDVT